MFTPVLSKYKCNPYYIPDWLIIALGDFMDLGAMNVRYVNIQYHESNYKYLLVFSRDC